MDTGSCDTSGLYPQHDQALEDKLRLRIAEAEADSAEQAAIVGRLGEQVDSLTGKLERAEEARDAALANQAMTSDLLVDTQRELNSLRAVVASITATLNDYEHDDRTASEAIESCWAILADPPEVLAVSAIDDVRIEEDGRVAVSVLLPSGSVCYQGAAAIIIERSGE